jgi:hypothetical protein
LWSDGYRTSREISAASALAFQERFGGGCAGRIPDDASAVIGVWAYANFVVTEFYEVHDTVKGRIKPPQTV